MKTNTELPIACLLKGPEFQKRRRELAEFLAKMNPAVRELHHGYEFYFNGAESIPEILDFAKFEASCCPFFNFDLSIRPKSVSMKITGSSDAKTFLRDELFQFKLGLTTLPRGSAKRLGLIFVPFIACATMCAFPILLSALGLTALAVPFDLCRWQGILGMVTFCTAISLAYWGTHKLMRRTENITGSQVVNEPGRKCSC